MKATQANLQLIVGIMYWFFQTVWINSKDIFRTTLFSLMKTIIKSLVNK